MALQVKLTKEEMLEFLNDPDIIEILSLLVSYESLEEGKYD